MRDALLPQDADQVGRGIRLDRIHRLAGKRLDKETRGAGRSMRAIEDNGLIR